MRRTPARAAAWDAYLAVTCGLLPALGDGTDDREVDAWLGRLTMRFRRYAPMWHDHGPILVRDVYEAIDCHETGDYDRLDQQLRAVAARLFAVSSGRAPQWRRYQPPST